MTSRLMQRTRQRYQPFLLIGTMIIGAAAPATEATPITTTGTTGGEGAPPRILAKPAT